MTSEPPRRAETKSIWPALPSNSAGPTSAQEHAFAPRISISIHDHSAACASTSALAVRAAYPQGRRSRDNVVSICCCVVIGGLIVRMFSFEFTFQRIAPHLPSASSIRSRIRMASARGCSSIAMRVKLDHNRRENSYSVLWKECQRTSLNRVRLEQRMHLLRQEESHRFLFPFPAEVAAVRSSRLIVVHALV